MAVDAAARCRAFFRTSGGSGRARRFLREMLRLGMMMAAVSGLLTILATRYLSEPSLRVTALIFAANFMFSLGIGGTMNLIYGTAFPALAGPRPSTVRLVAVHALMLTVGSIVGVEITLLIKRGLPFLNFEVQRVPAYQIAFVIGLVIVVLITAYERMKERAHRSERELELARQEAMHAQLEALQARTNPHFLFNSLNTVAGLIEEDPRRAEAVIEKFSDLLRYSLTSARRDRVTLGEELDVVRGYLEVEGLRLGGRLRAQVEVDPGLEAIEVPPLVLQPLVENAVLHGVAPRREGGSVRVEARRDHDMLVLTVEDDGPGAGKSTHRGTQTGLAGIEKRLQLLYGGAAVLEKGDGARGGFRIRIALPLAVPGVRPALGTGYSSGSEARS